MNRKKLIISVILATLIVSSMVTYGYRNSKKEIEDKIESVNNKLNNIESDEQTTEKKGIFKNKDSEGVQIKEELENLEKQQGKEKLSQKDKEQEFKEALEIFISDCRIIIETSDNQSLVSESEKKRLELLDLREKYKNKEISFEEAEKELVEINKKFSF